MKNKTAIKLNYITRTLSFTNISKLEVITNNNIHLINFTIIWSDTIAKKVSLEACSYNLELQKNDLIVRFDSNYDLDCFIIHANKQLSELKEKMQIIDFCKF